MASDKVVKPYSEDESKREQIEQMFDSIAPTYDFLNHFLSLGIDRRWRKKALLKLKEKHPSSILDIATGTADFAIQAQDGLGVDKIVGADISEGMLEIGRKKILKKGLENAIILETGDSEQLKYDDATFDAVMVAYGVRNFQNLDKGLTEMGRVLKENGTMLILEFTKPKFFLFRWGFNLYFKYVLPLIGRLTSKDPKAYKYLFDSVQAFPDYDKFTLRMEKAGIKDVKWESLSMGICAIYWGVKS